MKEFHKLQTAVQIQDILLLLSAPSGVWVCEASFECSRRECGMEGRCSASHVWHWGTPGSSHCTTTLECFIIDQKQLEKPLWNSNPTCFRRNQGTHTQDLGSIIMIWTIIYFSQYFLHLWHPREAEWLLQVLRQTAGASALGFEVPALSWLSSGQG